MPLGRSRRFVVILQMPLLLVLLLVALPGRARAQGATRVVGIVRALGGGALPGVTVHQVGSGRAAAPGSGATTRTDSAGRFALAVPAGDSLTLVFTRDGFRGGRMRLAPLRAGERRTVAITLLPLAALDAVTVTAERERPLLDTRSATTGGAVERLELARLPTDARDPLTLAFTVPGVAQATGFFGDAPPLSLDGENSLYTSYTVDGLDNNEGYLGGPRVEMPLDAIERFSVLANSYPAEWGRSANGVVNVETRAGGSAWHGDAFVFRRPGIPLDAKPEFAPPDVDPKGFRRTQVGATLGGPLLRGRTFVFGTAEYSDEQEDRIGSTARTQFLGTELRHTLKLFTRLDHGWTPSQTTTVRFAMSDVGRIGQGGGDIVPEADITTKRVGSLASIMHLSALAGGRASNTAAFQVGTFHWYFPPARSNLQTPQVTIVAPDSVTPEAVVGSTNYVFDERELQLELHDVFEAQVGAGHVLRAGADITRGAFRLFASSTNPSGAYTVIDDGNINASGPFLSIRDIPADVRVVSYSVDAAPQHVNATQTLYGAFAEDQWHATPALTVTAGLRWDYDDLTSRGGSKPDLTNFQPRLGASWLIAPNTVVRGALGAYSGKFLYTIYSDAVQFGPQGDAVVTLQAPQNTPPAFLKGPPAASLAGLRSTFPPQEERLMFARGLRMPRSEQASLGVQHEFGTTWALSVDGVWMETFHLPRSWDLNPDTRPIGPADTVNLSTAAGDPFRPVQPVVGSYRRLTTTDAGGRSRYVGLYTNLRKRVSDAATLEATWVWSHAQNNTEDVNFNASHANDFGAEWADAVNDRRHKVSVRGTYAFHDGLHLSGIADFQTGTPVNRIADFRDLDGSGDIYGNSFIGNYDRFYGVARNGERLPQSLQLSASAEYALRFGPRSLALRADVFNLLNSKILTGFANGIPGGGPRTQVGRPGDPMVFTTAGPPRQVQLSLEYRF